MNFIQKKQVATLFAYTELDDIISVGIDNMQNIETLKQFNGYINDLIAKHEVSDYSCAVRYLLKDPQNYKKSLALANEYGYETKDFTSVLLASLLYQHELQETLDGSQSELEDIFNEIG